MSPSDGGQTVTVPSFPRVSGDEPANRPPLEPHPSFSPRERG